MVVLNIISMIYLYGILVDLNIFKNKVFYYDVINNYYNIIDSCI